MKIFKTKNDKYISADSIVHNRKKLSEILSEDCIEIQTVTITTTASSTAYICNMQKQVLSVWFASDDSHNGYIIPYRFGNNGWYGKFKTFSDANIANESCKIQIALLNKST